MNTQNPLLLNAFECVLLNVICMAKGDLFLLSELCSSSIHPVNLWMDMFN